MSDVSNIHTSREAWLQAAGDTLRPLFASRGYDVPAAVRYSIGFPGTGRSGTRIGECWHCSASADGHFEIFIRPDQHDPVQVLDCLTHELVHTCMPQAERHGRLFRKCATAVGLTGPMRSTKAGPELHQRLCEVVEQIGPLPHGRLDWTQRRKQMTRLLKVQCAVCGYPARVTRQWLDESGPPLCPEHRVPMVAD